MCGRFLSQKNGVADKKGEVEPYPDTGLTVLWVLGELSDAKDLTEEKVEKVKMTAAFFQNKLAVSLCSAMSGLGFLAAKIPAVP